MSGELLQDVCVYVCVCVCACARAQVRGCACMCVQGGREGEAQAHLCLPAEGPGRWGGTQEWALSPMRAPTPTLAHAHAHARARTHTHTCTDLLKGLGDREGRSIGRTRPGSLWCVFPDSLTARCKRGGGHARVSTCFRTGACVCACGYMHFEPGICLCAPKYFGMSTLAAVRIYHERASVRVCQERASARVCHERASVRVCHERVSARVRHEGASARVCHECAPALR